MFRVLNFMLEFRVYFEFYVGVQGLTVAFLGFRVQGL